MSQVYSFSATQYQTAPEVLEAIGSRGKHVMQLSSLEMPIAPGFIVDNETIAAFPDKPDPGWKLLKSAVDSAGKDFGKAFGSAENPLLVKVVESPMLNVSPNFRSIHNLGLCEPTLPGFAEKVGEDFAYQEYAFLVSLIAELESEAVTDKARLKSLDAFIKALRKAKTKNSVVNALTKHDGLMPSELYTDAAFQLSYVVRKFRDAIKDNPTASDSALMVQAMVYGNFDAQSSFGAFYTHHIVTGEKVLQGSFVRQAFDDSNAEGEPIAKIDKEYLDHLTSIARTLEHTFKEIRQVRFTIESGKLWLIDQTPVPGKSAQAEIRTLLDLHAEGVVDDAHVINAVKPGRLSEILHSSLDPASVAKVHAVSGGIAGAVGAAIGRVFFNTDKLIEEHRAAVQRGEDADVILAMPSTLAEDVKGIEIAKGVLASEGGYASHAPVVARSLGKVAMVYPEIQWLKNSMKIGGKTVKEGDYITLNVPYYEDPTIYLGKGVLTKPTPEDSGLLEFLDIVQKKIGDFDVHANADQPRDAALSRTFGATGIGLCRTEHMFFSEDRINRFRLMILARDEKDRVEALESLRPDQTEDFYNLLKIMDGYPVTIRLLDAPLHEFLPSTREAMKEFITTIRKMKPSLTPDEIRGRSSMLREFNPMLGHRGVRIAISYPEIYRMQIRAIFEAAYRLKKEGKDPHPEIMIPIVMSASELKVMRNGKKIEGKTIQGITDIEQEIRKAMKAKKPVDYKVGTMIELPAAALQAHEISRYADFFSFGTNDLTQTTTGLSRDDFNNFFSDYNELDLLEANPFKVLVSQVKEMIEIASTRGRIARPDISLGLCGEHGAEPSNMEFFHDVGLNYVSVSPYGIPIAKLAISQMNLKQQGLGA